MDVQPTPATVLCVSWIAEEILEAETKFQIGDHQVWGFTIGQAFAPGQQVELVFDHVEGKRPLDECLLGNPLAERRLEWLGSWSYDGYGVIVTVDPVCADFGPFILELGDWTKDEGLVGQPVLWPIGRLDAYRADDPRLDE